MKFFHIDDENDPIKARTVYNVPHKIPWGIEISLYLWTKSIAAGAFLVGGLATGLHFLPETALLKWGGSLLSFLFFHVTGALLLLDLERPERFYTVLLKPHWKSWLTIGAFIFTIYGGILALWLLAGLFGLEGVRTVLHWPGLVFAVLTATYTGFLFAQARGRGLWQSPLMPMRLLVQAVLAGTASLLLIGILTGGVSKIELSLLSKVLKWSLFFNLFILLFGEFLVPHPNRDVSQAIQSIVTGPFKVLFWGGVIMGGSLLPLLLLLAVEPLSSIAFVVSVLVLAGELAFAHVWVAAGQIVPLS
jgi:formate-dependent nitrite reductase membrane component NrfD